MGEARHPPQRTPRPAHRFHLYLWRRLSKPGQGRSPHPAVLQHRGDEPAPRGNSQDRHAREPRRSIGRSGWLAPVDTPRRATKHHHYRFAAKIPRTQSGREHLAIHARQLAVKPHLQVLRRSCRSLLLRLEQARRSALENHVHRIAPVGPRVLINETWYKTFFLPCRTEQWGRCFKGMSKLNQAPAIGLPPIEAGALTELAISDAHSRRIQSHGRPMHLMVARATEHR